MRVKQQRRIGGRRGHLEQARRERGVRRGLRSSGAAATVVMVAVAGGVVAAAPPLPDPMPKPGDVRTGIFADKSRAQATGRGTRSERTCSGSTCDPSPRWDGR